MSKPYAGTWRDPEEDIHGRHCVILCDVGRDKTMALTMTTAPQREVDAAGIVGKSAIGTRAGSVQYLASPSVGKKEEYESAHIILVPERLKTPLQKHAVDCAKSEAVKAIFTKSLTNTYIHFAELSGAKSVEELVNDDELQKKFLVDLGEEVFKKDKESNVCSAAEKVRVDGALIKPVQLDGLRVELEDDPLSPKKP